MLCKRFAASEKYFRSVNTLFASKISYDSHGATKNSATSNLILDGAKSRIKCTNVKIQHQHYTRKSTVYDAPQSTHQSSTSSVDPEEIKKFQALSESWWVENGEFEALHRLNLLRVPLVRDTMVNYRNSLQPSEKNKTLMKSDESKSWTPSKEPNLFSDDELACEPLLGLNILDVGCGGGILSEVELNSR